MLKLGEKLGEDLPRMEGEQPGTLGVPAPPRLPKDITGQYLPRRPWWEQIFAACHASSSAHGTSALPAQGPCHLVSGKCQDVSVPMAQPPTRCAPMCANAAGQHRMEETGLIPS